MIASGTNDALVQLQGACKRFQTPEGGWVTALDDVHLTVGGNEFVTLLGPSGCGKTTLLRCISGFEELDAGRLKIGGRDMTAVPAYRRPVNTVFQNYALFPHMTVGANVGYSLEVAGVNRQERRRRVAEALALVNLERLEQRRPAQLSGGQQQRVALARAIISRPQILLLDEPLSALDRRLRQTMQLELKNLQHELGISFVFVTHDQEEALTMSDRIVVLDQGRIQQMGRPTEIYHRPANAFVAQFIGESNLFEARINRIENQTVYFLTNEGLELPGWLAPAYQVGARVRLLLRPEHLVPVGDNNSPQAQRARLSARLAQEVFLGSEYHLVMHTEPGDKALKVTVRDADRAALSGIEPGARLQLHYALNRLHVLPE